MTKFNMKFDIKRLTIFILICGGLAFVMLQRPKEISDKELKNFNRDFKNYNVNLDIFEGEEKKVASFKVAIANTDKKRMYGLMNLEYLPQNHGMIFIFPGGEMVNMWMKNTLIPLDMIFIDADSEISSIATDTVPGSLELISSKKEIAQVLEINAGLVNKLGIKVGQKVRMLNAQK